MVFLNREEKHFEGGKRDIFIYNKSILKVKKDNPKFFFSNEIELFIIKNNNYNILDHVPNFMANAIRILVLV